MSAKVLINYLFLKSIQRQCIKSSNIRYLSSKHMSEKFKSFETKDEKDLSKVMVTLVDTNGVILGTKSLIESRILATKLNLNLIEDTSDDKRHKYKVFKLVSNQYLAKNDSDFNDICAEEVPKSDVQNSDNKKTNTLTKSAKEVKRLVFSTKLSENDLMTKFNQMKKWLSRGHPIAVNITNQSNDTKVLDQMLAKFETELKLFGKINQKKIKSNKNLKFMIVSIDDSRDQLKSDPHEELNDDIDVEHMDPNTLLSDEFEEQLDKK